jgi:hypothetical protein
VKLVGSEGKGKLWLGDGTCIAADESQHDHGEWDEEEGESAKSLKSVLTCEKGRSIGSIEETYLHIFTNIPYPLITLFFVCDLYVFFENTHMNIYSMKK